MHSWGNERCLSKRIHIARTLEWLLWIKWSLSKVSIIVVVRYKSSHDVLPCCDSNTERSYKYKYDKYTYVITRVSIPHWHWMSYHLEIPIAQASKRLRVPLVRWIDMCSDCISHSPQRTISLIICMTGWTSIR